MMTQSLPEKSFRFALPTNLGKKHFAIQQIIRLESDSNYTYVHFSDRKPLLVARVLREFEVLLKPMGFIRTHRSHLINKHHITGLDAEGFISLSDDSRAAISRRKRKIVINEINSPFIAA